MDLWQKEEDLQYVLAPVGLGCQGAIWGSNARPQDEGQLSRNAPASSLPAAEGNELQLCILAIHD
jgi:hypothetical protein